jgi:hypothetical protein
MSIFPSRKNLHPCKVHWSARIPSYIIQVRFIQPPTLNDRPLLFKRRSDFSQRLICWASIYPLPKPKFDSTAASCQDLAAQIDQLHQSNENHKVNCKAKDDKEVMWLTLLDIVAELVNIPQNIAEYISRTVAQTQTVQQSPTLRCSTMILPSPQVEPGVLLMKKLKCRPCPFLLAQRWNTRNSIFLFSNQTTEIILAPLVLNLSQLCFKTYTLSSLPFLTKL